MDKNYLIQLTNNLYRLTLLFPKKEPLRYKMREIATDILTNFISGEISPKFPGVGPLDNLAESLHGKKLLEKMIEDLEVLDSFFEVTKGQNWVSPIELLRIQEEYNKIKTEIKKLAKKLSEEKGVLEEFIGSNSSLPTPRPPSAGGGWEISTQPLQVSFSKTTKTRPLEMNSRQKKILEFLKENGQAQVKDLKQIFSEVSKRTLRRDFRFLLKQGKIERIGERNETFYQIKK